MKNNRGPLYLPVEVKVRELDAKLLLAYYAVKKGYHVFIGEHRMVELASKVYGSGIFFSKGYPKRFRRRIITNARTDGHMIVELDEEGLIIENKDEYVRDRMSGEMLHYVTQEYCWGQSQQEMINRTYQNFSDRCYVTGNPRFDLLKPTYRMIYEEDANNLRNKYGNFILINTRFSIYNAQHSPKNNHPLFTHIRNLFEKFLEFIKEISKQFPSTNFIIRPHPGENSNSYRKEFSSYQNVHVIHEGNIVKWLIGSKLVIHNGCTSSVEAFLLDKPIITYNPFSTNEQNFNLPNSLGFNTSTIDEVIQIIEDVLHDKHHTNTEYVEQYNRGKEILNHYYPLNNNDYSFELILQLLENIQNTSLVDGSQKQKKQLHLKDNKKVKHFFPSLTKMEINHFFQRLDRMEGNSIKCKINKVGKNVYQLFLT